MCRRASCWPKGGVRGKTDPVALEAAEDELAEDELAEEQARAELSVAPALLRRVARSFRAWGDRGCTLRSAPAL
jgi:hypothetical protein